MAAPAEQGEQPPRIGIVAPADIHAEPDRVLETGTRAVRPLRTVALGAVEHLFGGRHLRAVRLDQSRGQFLGRSFGEQPAGKLPVIIVDLHRLEQGGEQPLAVVPPDILRRRRLDPFGGNPRAAQHHVDALAARIGDDQQRRALLAGAPGAARAVLQRLGIARKLDMDDEAQRRKIDAARGDVGGDTDAGAAIAERLEGRVALVLAVLARQRDRIEAALDEARMEPADIVAGGAEQHRGFGVVEAEDVDHRILDIGRGHCHRLVADVAMAAILAHRRDTQRILLIAFGERDDRLGNGRGEEKGAALLRGCVEDLLQIVAKAHVEHLVRLVEHRDPKLAEIERAAFEMVAQPARRADHDMRALSEVAALL